MPTASLPNAWPRPKRSSILAPTAPWRRPRQRWPFPPRSRCMPGPKTSRLRWRGWRRSRKPRSSAGPTRPKPTMRGSRWARPAWCVASLPRRRPPSRRSTRARYAIRQQCSWQGRRTGGCTWRPGPEPAPTARRSTPSAAQAQTQLQTSLDAQRKAAESNPSGAAQLVDTELLLAELRLDAGDAQGSAELIAPLAENLRKQKPQPLDNSHLRIFLADARAGRAGPVCESLAPAPPN